MHRSILRRNGHWLLVNFDLVNLVIDRCLYLIVRYQICVVVTGLDSIREINRQETVAMAVMLVHYSQSVDCTILVDYHQLYNTLNLFKNRSIIY